MRGEKNSGKSKSKDEYGFNKVEIKVKNLLFNRRSDSPDGLNRYCRSCTLAYKHAHPESQVLERAKARAKKYGIPFEITRTDVVIPKRCPVLGIPLFMGKGRGNVIANSPSLDKIIPVLGYIPGNVEVISHKANTMKSSASAWELFRFVQYYVDKLQEPDQPLPESVFANTTVIDLDNYEDDS